MAVPTIGVDLIRQTCPSSDEADTPSLRGRWVAQGFVELGAHIVDVSLGVLGVAVAAITLFQTQEINIWAFGHFTRVEYLFCRPFVSFLTARTLKPHFEEPPALDNQTKDELNLVISSPKYTLYILEPANQMIKTAVKSEFFFGQHIFSRMIGITAGVIALVVLIGEKILGLIAAMFAIALGDNEWLNYHAYDLLRIHEGFAFVPYFLYFGIVSPACCVPDKPTNT
jgi:hypothetical protein